LIFKLIKTVLLKAAIRPFMGLITRSLTGLGFGVTKLLQPGAQDFRETYQLSNSVVTRRFEPSRQNLEFSMNKISVAIIDDHQVVIDGLVSMFSDDAEITISIATTKPEELLSFLHNNKPDIVLLDISMPELNGIDLCGQILRLNREIRVIAFSSFDDTHFVRQILRKGASGYILKNASRQTLINAIKTVHQGKEYIDETVQKVIVQESITGQRRSMYEIPLTKREKEVLKLIAEEHTNQEIADKLFLSLRTVETHRANLTQKLDAKNTASLVKEAIKRGLIT
jgi:DNA-binding NarL/FixJ family response regulator